MKKNTIIDLKEIIKILPDYVFRVSDKLISNGYEAYLVGGSVRDLLIGKKPKDFDIATNARPEQIQNLFPKSVATGAKFGTIVVVVEDGEGERFDVEVTTYRSESDYFGGRWPAKVEFSKTIDADLSRRDFTINAMAINLDNPEEDGDHALMDLFEGKTDLENGVIRAVGDPFERFEEDGLRTIRACRLASVLGFEVETTTFNAIPKTLHITKMVSIERVREELEKIVMNSPKPSVGFRLLEESGILELYIPELVKAKDVYQPEYHADNLFDHSLKTLDLAEDEIKWSALFHDIGKIETQTEDESGIHFYGHDRVGSDMAAEIMKRLRFSNEEIKKTKNLVRWHMFYYPSGDWRKEYAVEELDSIVEEGRVQHGWSDSAIRRFIRNIGGVEELENLIKLRIADATSNPKSTFSTKEIDVFQERVSEVLKKDMALKITDLDISGADLQEMGYQPGPKFKKILGYLLEVVTEDPEKNRNDILRDIVVKVFPRD